MDISAKAEYWSAYELYLDNTDCVMEPLYRDRISSFNIFSVPLRVSYGLTDDLSLRFSAQFFQIDEVFFGYARNHQYGYGLGDSKIELLYQFVKESAEGPSIAVNAGADVLTGINYMNLPKADSDTTLATGTYAPNYYLSAIFGKKMDAWNGKAMIGYIVTPIDRRSSSTTIDPADQIICSLLMSTAAGDAVEYGGEISAKFSGEDNRDEKFWIDTFDQDHSPVTRISLSPFIIYRQSEALSWKGVLEVPLATKGTTSWADFGLNRERGINLSIGGELLI